MKEQIQKPTENNKKIDPHMCGQLIFDKGDRQVSGEKRLFKK